MLNTDRQRQRSFVFACVVAAAILTSWNLGFAQDPVVADMLADPDSAAAETDQETTLNLFTLIVSGGFLMVPIGIMSIVVITLVFRHAIKAANVASIRDADPKARVSTAKRVNERFVLQICVV